MNKPAHACTWDKQHSDFKANIESFVLPQFDMGILKVITNSVQGLKQKLDIPLQSKETLKVMFALLLFTLNSGYKGYLFI